MDYGDEGDGISSLEGLLSGTSLGKLGSLGVESGISVCYCVS